MITLSAASSSRSAGRRARVLQRASGALAAIAAAALLAACGGGEPERVGLMAERMAQAAASAPADGRRQALAAAQLTDVPAASITDFYAWAEWKLADILPAAGVVQVERELIGQTFVIRVYTTGFVIAVGRGNGDVYALPPSEGAAVIALGRLADFAPEVAATVCNYRPDSCTAVSGGTVGTPSYGRPLLVTLTGIGVNANLALSSPGCSGFTLSTTPPNASTPATAYYTCTVTGQGAQEVTVTRTLDNRVLTALPYTVPAPQVTMTLSNNAGTTGDVVITLSPAQAPVTVNNFLQYVNSGFYDGTAFHRHSPGFVLQGGGYAAPLTPGGAVPPLKATNAPIALEVNRGLSNTVNTVAMARTNVLNSATSQFFVNLGNNAFLDTASGGYAVFGSVTAGTALLAQITAAPCTPWPQLLPQGDCTPVPNFVITSARQTR